MDNSLIPTKPLVLKIFVGVFVGVLLCLGLLFFILPHKKISETEKRELTPLPQFSWNSFFKGHYTDSLDVYFGDNFPFREHWLGLSFAIDENLGWHSEEIGFYKTETVMNPELEKKPSPDTTKKALVEEKATKTHGIFIYKGMAIQVFGGDKHSATTMANVINLYQQKLQGKAKIYAAIAPTHGEYYLPEKYQVASESKNIQFIYDHLSPEISRVDICGELRKHQNEYIYFNTDHHWTGLGAYYAYVAFCKTADLIPVELATMDRKVKNNFLGSLYWMTRDNRLKENIDSVVYYKPCIEYKAYATTVEAPHRMVSAFIFAEFAKGPNSYGVYLGADFPLMRVDTENKNGKKILIIKNSYGNPFVTYLIPHFEQIYIIDYRHYNDSISELVQKNNITEVVLFNVASLANTYPQIEKIKSIL